MIRDVEDRGVLVVCDPRLVSRSYGKIFVNSLPAMVRSRSMEDVRRFFATESALDSPAKEAAKSQSL